jgi:hypothetical protein
MTMNTASEALQESALYRLPDGAIVGAYRHDDPGLVWGLRGMLGDGYDDWYAVTEDGVMVRWWLCSEDPPGGFPVAAYVLADLEPWPPAVLV